jgi:U6 snRNA-associated Sm-like protein LSm7
MRRLNTKEVLLPINQDENNEITQETKQLGLVVCRATAILLISPFDGYEEIENPFIQQD